MHADEFPPNDLSAPTHTVPDHVLDENDVDGSDPRGDEPGWRELLFGRWNSLWFLVMAIGLVLFELTAQPSLVAVAICSKFGLADIRNGYWLRRRDPARVRGKVLFWFSLSRGLWKTTLAGFVAMFAFVWLAAIFGQRQFVARGHVVGSAATFLFGFVLGSLTTMTGVILARIGGIRVWLDAGISEAREDNEFPPPETSSNRISLIVAASLILPVIIFLMVLAGVAQANPAAIRNAVGFLLGMFVLPVVIIGAGTALSRAIVARTWEDCWAWEPVRRRRSLRDVAVEEGVIEGSVPLHRDAVVPRDGAAER